MASHSWALILYGVGVTAILFSLVRTYYRIWKIKKQSSATPQRNSKSI